MQPRRHFTQLKSTGAETVAIDVTTANRRATFRFDGIDARSPDGGWYYAQEIRVYVRTQVDQPTTGGAIIYPDQFGRAVESFTLKSDDLGTVYSEGDLNGPALWNIAGVVSNRYAYPWGMLRSGVPAADGDTPLEIPFSIPLGHRCFHKGHQTGVWNGFLKNGGQLEINLAASTWPAAVSTGAASEATTDVRAELVYTEEPEARPPVIWTWRLRNTEANQSKHELRNVCQGKGLAGALGRGKIAFLAYLTDVAGLGGADGVDNITRVWPRDLTPQALNLGSPFYGPASYLGQFLEDINSRSVFPSEADQAWPFTLGTAVTGRPNVATAMFLPYLWPDPDGQMVSKLVEWSGKTLNIEHDYTAVPTAQGAWLLLEQSYLSEQQKEYLMGARMGLPPGQFQKYLKLDRPLNHPGDLLGQANQAKKLRGLPEKIRAA